jgi:hypothetical protein
MPKYRDRDDVPDDVRDRHPGSTWTLWPNPRRGPWLVRVDWTQINDRLECCGFEIRSVREKRDGGWPAELRAWDENPEVLTAAQLRHVRLGGLLHDLREDGWEKSQKWADWLATVAADLGGAELAADVRRDAAKHRGRRRLRGLPPLTDVAQIYQDAQARRENPTKAVATHWRAAHSTAAKWVMRARAEGHLPPVTPRRHGATRKGRQ